VKITLIGDVHGKTDQYQKKLRQKYAGQRTLQLGDMGVGFKGTPGLHKDIMTSGDHRWIRGNHDDPAKCRASIGYLGDYGYLEEDKLFYLGGAYSIDHAWRIPDVSWWADEEISYPELAKAIDLYIAKKPKYVATHEAPSRISEYMLQVVAAGFRSEKLQCIGTRTAAALQQMLDVHMPEEWVFGHYHIDTTFTWRGTKFTCLNELSCYTITDEPSIT
jgi:calcineurin-like phosphoesterase family protein